MEMTIITVNTSVVFSIYSMLLIKLLVFCFRHQKYIGKVKHAVFHTQKTGRKRVVVSTEENVIASLDLRTGDICEFTLVLGHERFLLFLAITISANFLWSCSSAKFPIGFIFHFSFFRDFLID